jgi:hypothetical protein
METVYLVNAYGFEWHRTIAVFSDKDKAIDLARVTGNCYKEAPRGCEVWEHEVNGGEGKRVYPDW